MMTKVTYLLRARADEDLRSGPLTTTDTRQDLVPTVARPGGLCETLLPRTVRFLPQMI